MDCVALRARVGGSCEPRDGDALIRGVEASRGRGGLRARRFDLLLGAVDAALSVARLLDRRARLALSVLELARVETRRAGAGFERLHAGVDGRPVGHA